VIRHFTVIDAPQRSPEWFAARCGRVTGSVAKVLYTEGRKKGEPSVQRRDLCIRLACEAITGLPLDEDFVKPAHMERGIEMEPAAFSAFEAATGLLAHTSGFLSHDTEMAGCSLDGHVGDFEAILEVKCPKTFTHLKYLRAGVAPPDYEAQIVHNLWMSGAACCYFVSFDDRLPADLALFIVKVERNEAAITEHARRVTDFLRDVNTEKQAIEALRKGR
jgi:hypothetical protein